MYFFVVTGKPPWLSHFAELNWNDLDWFNFTTKQLHFFVQYAENFRLWETENNFPQTLQTVKKRGFITALPSAWFNCCWELRCSHLVLVLFISFCLFYLYFIPFHFWLLLTHLGTFGKNESCRVIFYHISKRGQYSVYWLRSAQSFISWWG